MLDIFGQDIKLRNDPPSKYFEKYDRSQKKYVLLIIVYAEKYKDYKRDH